MVNGATDTTQDRKPVYIAFKTFLTALETLEQGVPPVIDRYVWRTFSGSLQAQTLSAFKFLGLVDEAGRAQTILHEVIDAKGDDRKQILRDLIESKYAGAIKLGESNASFQQLQDLFRGYGVTGGTLEMAVRFFTDACNYTSLKCSPHWITAKRTKRGGGRKDTPPNKSKVTPPTEGEKNKATLPDKLALHPMLQGLITELPEAGSVLDSQKREALKKYFDIILDIMYVKE